jgi:predicted nucleic acid-binding protein
MSKTIFIDSDVILDVLCKREPHYDSAAKIFTMADEGTISLSSTPLVFANIFYILRKLLGRDKARELLRKLRLIIRIMPINQKITDLALNSEFSDFEDAIQYFSVRENGISIILTRNVKDYKVKDVAIYTPTEFISIFNIK